MHQSYYSGLCIFAETFKDATVRAYVGLRVKADSKGQPIDENKLICQLCQHPIAVKGGNTSN